ncbi:MAG: VTT domain-containing protein [Gammaproteobacteria bacterium]|nr:VTT domain-containing protein [Gammaproteobacteria bacterium]MBU1654944.1 VTT domain-containing protein [Gammaproteobacteria bacterium]MBU1960496.1 VTT domain-containing protein [Gammaproteobacteria bacterium]
MERNKLLRWGGLVLLAGAIVLALIYRDRLDAAELERLVAGAGVAGPLLFMLIYALATVLFLPGSVLTLAGGALFGPVLGTFYNLTGATAGAVLAFLAARFFAAGWVERKAGGRLKQLKEGVEAEGWRFVAFVRLVPLFPFNLLNYALGLTRIPLGQYLVASYLFMLPGALGYTYLGYAGREALAGGEGLIQKGLLALALLGGVAFLPRLAGRMRRGDSLGIEELRARLDRAEGLLLDVRSTADYRGDLGHIASARNIPLEELETRLEELSPYRGQPLAIICTTDRRSRKAAQLLAGRGFADLRVVSGGMTRWNQSGLPVEKG